MEIDVSKLRTDLPQVGVQPYSKSMPIPQATVTQRFKMRLTTITEKILNWASFLT